MKQQFEKGDEITYLDYQIRYCTNNDGIVLYKDVHIPGRKDYESHLGNFRDLDDAKRYAVMHYMIARPERFATHIAHYITGTGTMHEFDALKISIAVDGIAMPDDITVFDPLNRLIAVCGKSLHVNKQRVDEIVDENKMLKDTIAGMKQTLSDAVAAFAKWMQFTLTK